MNKILHSEYGQSQDQAVIFEHVILEYAVPAFALSISNLKIRRGESLSIVGRSGTGKTTLLLLIQGLAHPTAGRIVIEGLTAPDARHAGVFGVAFQNPALLPWLTVASNVALPDRLRGSAPDLARIEELLAAVGLWEYRDAYPADLSGGMRSRVSLARALVRSPPILVLDEPFSSLDEFTRLQMATLVSKLQREAKSTMIFVTHNMTEALLLSDRVLTLGRGNGRSEIRRDFCASFRNRTLDVTSSEEFRKALAELAFEFQKEDRL